MVSAKGTRTGVADDQKEKAKPIEWEDEILVRCLQEEDRFPVGKVTRERHTIGK